jgi:hypothetical protein
VVVGTSASPPTPPTGWDTHPLAGSEAAFFPSGAGITVDASWTSAIIWHPAEMTLTPSLRLRWSWRVEALPSRLPEDTALTHDYLSVALEFDDDQDLTWYGVQVGDVVEALEEDPGPVGGERRRGLAAVPVTGEVGEAAAVGVNEHHRAPRLTAGVIKLEHDPGPLGGPVGQVRVADQVGDLAKVRAVRFDGEDLLAERARRRQRSEGDLPVGPEKVAQAGDAKSSVAMITTPVRPARSLNDFMPSPFI